MGNAASIQSAIHNPKSAIPACLAAATLYAAFAVYLYRPHFGQFAGWDWLLPVSACIAALGGYVLSRRWVAGLTGSFLAGLVYGFGPFLLGLAKFHPASSLLAASVPWLFVPAAVSRASRPRSEGKMPSTRGKWLNLPLWLLPFAVITLFFYLSAGRRLFAAPLQVGVHPLDLAGFIAPLALIGRSTTLLGVYHVPVAALALGLAMIWKARRYGILLIAAAGLLLTFSRSFLDAGKVAWLGVSPILWLSIPMVWCAVLSGIGLQGLIEAGPADRKWILTAAILLGILAIVALLLATQCFQVFLGLADGDAQLFIKTATIYLGGAVATSIIFFLARQNLRLHWLRWAILCTALGIDIFLGATYIADRIF
jgi:hypothetical protein